MTPNPLPAERPSHKHAACIGKLFREGDSSRVVQVEHAYSDWFRVRRIAPSRGPLHNIRIESFLKRYQPVGGGA